MPTKELRNQSIVKQIDSMIEKGQDVNNVFRPLAKDYGLDHKTLMEIYYRDKGRDPNYKGELPVFILKKYPELKKRGKKR